MSSHDALPALTVDGTYPGSLAAALAWGRRQRALGGRPLFRVKGVGWRRRTQVFFRANALSDPGLAAYVADDLLALWAADAHVERTRHQLRLDGFLVIR